MIEPNIIIHIYQISGGKSELIPFDSSKGTFTVHKILPGYAMKVFDYDKSEIYENVLPKHGDALFHKMMSVISLNPGQILR